MKTLIAVLVLFFTVAFFNTVLGQTTYIDTAIQNATPAGVEHNQFYKEYLYAMTPTPPSGILVYAVPTIASQATSRWVCECSTPACRAGDGNCTKRHVG